MAQSKREQKSVPTPTADYVRRIGERVRGMRAQRGMTRKDLSHHSGISERYLAQVETGSANMSIEVLWRLAEAMDVGLMDLLPDNRSEGIELTPLRQFLDGLDLDQERQAYDMLLRHFANAQGPVKGVALIGLRGAGKTTLGQRLAGDVGIPFIKLSDVIEELGGMQMHELISLRGQKAYRRLEQEAVKHVQQNYDNVVLEIGGSLVSEKDTYNLVLSNFYTVWLKATPEEHMARVVAQGDTRPMQGSNEAMEDLKLILKEREPYYKAANFTLDTSGQSVEESAQLLMSKGRCYCCQWQWGQ